MMEAMPAATEAPATEAPAATEPPVLAAAPTQAPALDNSGQAMIAPTETAPAPDSAMKTMSTEEARSVEPGAQPAPEPVRAPIPLGWQIALLVVALAAGGLAWILVELANQSWRRKMK